ncbi:MAG: complex I subunit 1 family protein [Verrucomicrobiota bacterium]
MDWPFIIASLIKIIVFALAIVMVMVAYSVYAERRVSAAIQDRVGPNRVGPPLTLFGAKKDPRFAGLFQPMADGIKFLLKEDFTPNHVNKGFYWLAPALVLIPALLTCAVLPFGSELDLGFLGIETPIPMVIANLNAGPLFIFAIASLGVYGIVLAGWASNSKYAFFGGVRSTSQMISYELSLGLSLVPLLLIYSQLNLVNIVQFQDANGWLMLPMWGEGWTLERWVLLIPIFISFLIFTTSIFAETNRTPFDLPECETELVAGYHTEYSSMKFALFFMGEYAAMIVGSGLIVTLFFGGWSIPFAPYLGLAYEAGNTPFWLGLLHIACFLAKIVVFIIFFIFVRWTIPRFRYDKLMDLGWKVFFEVALVNIFLTALIIWFFNRS